MRDEVEEMEEVTVVSKPTKTKQKKLPAKSKKRKK